MRNQCSCGNVFEFSEKTIGSLIVCQHCKREVVLKDDSKQTIPKLGGKQRRIRFFRWSFIYVLFLAGIFIYLSYYDRQQERKSILKATKEFQSTMGDNLGEQAKKILNQVRGQYPESTASWDIFPSEEEWAYYVTYTVFSPNGYILQEAVFQVIPSTPIDVFPVNELAVILQGDSEAQKQFLSQYEKRLKIPSVDLREETRQWEQTKERMDKNPFFNKSKRRKDEEEKEQKKE
ncbi:MAG: hypothetical protein AABZ60_17280 [Planctomycetota bacterium]